MRGRARNVFEYRRKKPTREPFERILIVCEGKATEPNYFKEIVRKLGIPSVNVIAIQSELGTDPLNVVKGAEKRFNEDRDFDAVYAVFDRDEHHRPYERAFSHAEKAGLSRKLDGSRQKHKIPLECIASVPCFELWFLLHFEEKHALCHRDEITTWLKQHISDYNKGKVGMYGETEEKLEIATARARKLKEKHIETRRQGTELYTDAHDLTERLRKMRLR